jgi:hypothetical protein
VGGNTDIAHEGLELDAMAIGAMMIKVRSLRSMENLSFSHGIQLPATTTSIRHTSIIRRIAPLESTGRIDNGRPDDIHDPRTPTNMKNERAPARAVAETKMLTTMTISIGSHDANCCEASVIWDVLRRCRT